MSKIFKVILPIKLNKEFHYRGNVEKPGDLVEVPFGRQKQLGIVWEEVQNSDCPANKLKDIGEVLVRDLYSQDFREFMQYFADYNITNLGQVLSLILPNKTILQAKTRKKDPILDPAELVYNAPSFSAAQQESLDKLKDYQQDNKFSVTFLNGITGSGKTELYFDLIAERLKEPYGQALILLPEILLTKQFIDKFEKRFNLKPQIWHSSTSAKDKKRIWQALLKNEIRIVVGARSALFLPFKQLRTIILDEEHDASYKQEDQLPYHGRDMAVVRAYKENIPILLASATPSLETRHNCDIGKYKEVCLAERYKGNLPRTHIIDMKRENLETGKWLSPELKKQISLKLASKEQAMLFLNRKGYAPLKICSNCGYRFKCESCDVWLVEHKKLNKLVCHHCDFKISNVKKCPKCEEEEKFVSYGPGVERIAEEVKEYFPEARVALITSEESKNLNVVKEIIEQIEKGEIDIIIGTQIISKGHHFSKLNLVGVIDGDIGDIADLRSSEKMFQLLSQISGRAGRESEGEVYIQAYNPESSFLKALLEDDSKGFYSAELANREKYNLPPYSRLIAVIISAEDRNYSEKIAGDLAKYLRTAKDISVLGPATAPLHFLRNKYRYRILIKISKEKSALEIFKPIMDDIIALKKASVKIEVDPVGFM